MHFKFQSGVTDDKIEAKFDIGDKVSLIDLKMATLYVVSVNNFLNWSTKAFWICLFAVIGY